MRNVKETMPFRSRQAEAKRISKKYPDRVPVVCEKALNSTLPDMEKNKFLVPGTMPCGEFQYIIHKHLNQAGCGPEAFNRTVYLFVQKAVPKMGASMWEVYEKYKAPDGFLYVSYSAESTLGSL